MEEEAKSELLLASHRDTVRLSAALAGDGRGALLQNRSSSGDGAPGAFGMGGQHPMGVEHFCVPVSECSSSKCIRRPRM